jgi:hypothetical protein
MTGSADAGYRTTVGDQGAEVGGGTPQDFAAFVILETRRWSDLVKRKATMVN